MDLRKQYQPSDGYTRIIERGEMGVTHLSFGIVNLDVDSAFFEDTAGDEVALVVLTGKCELLVGHNGNKAHGAIGNRSNVFDGKAYRAYIPCRTTYEILTHDEPVEAVVCRVPSAVEIAAVILEPGEELSDNIHKLIVTETPAHSIVGEGVGLYRLAPEDMEIHQKIYDGNQSVHQFTRIRNNEVIALPKNYRAEPLEAKVGVYSLWISLNGCA